MLIGMFGTGSRDLDRVIRNAFAGGEDGIWVAPRLGGMYQDAALATPWSADGQAVGGYVDRSPNGYALTQATSTARPAGYSNRLQFDGVDDNLFGGDVLDVGTGGMFLIAVASMGAGTNQYIAAKADTGSTDGRYALGRNSSGNLFGYFDSGSPDGGAYPDGGDTSLRVLTFEVRRSTGRVYTRRNAVALGDQAMTNPSFNADTLRGYVLGSYTATVNRLNGAVHEVVQVMRDAQPGEIEAIEERLIVAHAVETGGGGKWFWRTRQPVWRRHRRRASRARRSLRWAC